MHVFRNLYGEQLYNLFNIYISSAVLLAYNLTQIKKKRELLTGFSHEIIFRRTDHKNSTIPHIHTLLAIAEIVLISLFQHGFISPLNHYTGIAFNTGTNYFGMIIAMPILLPALCWIIGVDPLKQIDLITPEYPLALFFIKLGCFCMGC